MIDERFDSVLVSDFDGTMTRFDFYQLVLERLLPPDTPNYWLDYCVGRMTHFEALKAYFASIRAEEPEVVRLLDEMELDPELPRAVSTLHQAGWNIMVTSAGCAWYIEKLLGKHGVLLPLFANPGRFVRGKGLVMSLPIDTSFFSPTLGVDKARVVRKAQRDYRYVAFAGDGYPDMEAAEEVSPDLRFAKSSLAEAASSKGLKFISFNKWSDIADYLKKYSKK